MDCGRFQDQITDYIEGALDARARAECAAHRLRCRECREIYTDVKAAVAALSELDAMPAPEALEDRILAATTAGVMLNCNEFDRLLERFFDGVILAPTFQTFQAHFENCATCRRLLGSIENAIDLCREAKELEVEVPDALCDRIVAATSGPPSRRLFISRWRELPRLFTPQLAAAALIFLSTITLIGLRFGGVTGLASQASAQAEWIVAEGHAALNQTGGLALSGVQRVSNEVSNLLRSARRANSAAVQPAPESAPSPAASPSPQAQIRRNPGVRDPHRKRSADRRPDLHP